MQINIWLHSFHNIPEVFCKKLFKEEQIKIQETPIKASYRVDAEEISLTIPDAQTPDIVPENIPLDILYEDDSLLIVNKPKGMVVHPAHGTTMEHWSMH